MCFLLSAPLSIAAKKAAKGSDQKVAANNKNVKLGTNFVFDGLTASGRYQSPLGATAGIEKSKNLIDLVDYRTSLSDRIELTEGMR